MAGYLLLYLWNLLLELECFQFLVFILIAFFDVLGVSAQVSYCDICSLSVICKLFIIFTMQELKGKFHTNLVTIIKHFHVQVVQDG